MKIKTFVTIFPHTENIHLIKDVGMIPYILQKHHDFDSYIATYNNGNYQFLDTEVKGLKIRFIKKIFRKDFFNILFFIVEFDFYVFA